MTSYRLRFHKLALAEWHKVDGSLREPLKKKLTERLKNPRIPSAALSGMPDYYKIKLRSAGYRLVYRVDDDVVFVTVITVGKRDKQTVYETAQSRINNNP
ncbi:type II toxin-antitoxin system RelE family toxin [Thiovibrio frasassiensis]|uniref:Type II toxin-antitoxin system RelE/ParE family toxin n=1 Tax=Thiovibrio frasassiensis TaxID=2984131 RepID=A0A9X4RN26_9BACT|nr:type II toxin-antitoxin system RelE/ParE family toxin [Thiovibrio frasassiensis]MDG4476855.1 type II toxin-antitoxin system RelE/ParE family toxin [Thiovibrio frasassiensis]